MPMRTIIFAAAVLFGLMPPVAAAADPVRTVRNARDTRVIASEPTRPLIIRLPPPARPAAADQPLRLEPDETQRSDPLGASTVSIGPLRARLGGTATKAHIARYKLEGMDVLGGSVSGTIDGRGARVYLRWPPSDDE